MFSEPEQRVEAALKVRGAARYAADAALPGMLWSATLYSPLPHARIVSLNASAAKAMPGVHTVLTGDDLGNTLWGRRIRDWPLLAPQTSDSSAKSCRRVRRFQRPRNPLDSPRPTCPQSE